jgi:hypothetical protein
MPPTDESLDDITAEGRLAGVALGALLAASGAGLAVVSWDEAWRRCGEIAGECVSRSSGAVLQLVLAVGAIAAGLATVRRVRRRPLDPDGSARYVWVIGTTVALGAALLASRVPAFSCARGRFDDLLELCMHPPSTSEPARWLVAKQAIVAAGLVGSIVIAVRPRWARVTVPFAAAVWCGAFGWVLVETMVRSA